MNGFFLQRLRFKKVHNTRIKMSSSTTSSSSNALLDALFPVARMQADLVSSSWKTLPPVQLYNSTTSPPPPNTTPEVVNQSASAATTTLFVKGAFHLVHGAYVVVSDLRGIVLVGTCSSDALMRRYESDFGTTSGGVDIAGLLMQLEDGIRGGVRAGGGGPSPTTTQQSSSANPSASAAGGGSSSQQHSATTCVLQCLPTQPTSGAPQLLPLTEFIKYASSPVTNKNTNNNLSLKLNVMLPARLTKDVSISRPFALDMFPLRSLILSPDTLLSSCVGGGGGCSLIQEFIYEMVTAPMLRAQAALCGALAVLASQGRLTKEDFNDVFHHPVVRQHAQCSSIQSLVGNAPTFWPVVASAAFPAPAPEEVVPSGVGRAASSLVFPPQHAGVAQGRGRLPNSLEDSQINTDLVRVAGKKAVRDSNPQPVNTPTPISTSSTTSPTAVVTPPPVSASSAVASAPATVVPDANAAKKKLRKALL